MAERLPAPTIGRRVLDAIRIPRNGDRKSKQEYPLSYEERHQFEEECGEILGKEDFGREDFGNFCKNMIALARQKDDPKRFASLNDRGAKRYIDLNENGISIRSEPVATNDIGVSREMSYQHVSYEPQKRDYGLFGFKGGDFQPILITHEHLQGSNTTKYEYFSYFSGQLESGFLKRTPDFRREEKVSDKEVQGFCHRVYRVYTIDKAGLNFPPR